MSDAPKSETPTHMGAKDWMLLMALAAIWGTSFIVMKIALTAFQPFTIVMFRVGLASIALYITARVIGISFKVPRGVAVGSVIGAFSILAVFNNAIPFSLIVWGQGYISTTLASILNATMPLFTVFLAHFLAPDEKLTLRRVLGVFVGFAGVVVVILPTADGALTGSFGGQLAMLGAACSYGFAVVMARRFNRLGLHPFFIAWGQITGASLLMVPIALVVDQPWKLEVPGAAVWVSILFLSLVCSALAYVLYFRLLKTAGATNASLVTLLVPVFAIFIGITFLDEIFASEQVLGLTLIALGLLILDGRIFIYLRTRLA